MTTQAKPKRTSIKKVWNVLTRTAITAALFGSLSMYPEKAHAASVDNNPPELINAIISNTGTIELVYDEPVDTSHLPLESIKSIYQIFNTSNETYANITQITLDNNIVSLKAPNFTFTSSDTLTLNYKPDSTHYLSDCAPAPNRADEEVQSDIKNIDNITGPSLYSNHESTPSIVGNTLTLVYDEPLDTPDLPTDPVATLAQDIEGIEKPLNANSIHVEGSIVTITLNEAVKINNFVKLAENLSFHDKVGRPATTNSAEPVTNRTPAQLIEPDGITVNDQTITLTYDYPVISSGPPEALGQVYTVLDHGESINVVKAWAPEKEYVILTLSKPVKNGQDVKVIYNPTNKDWYIEDFRRNSVDSFEKWATDKTPPKIVQTSAVGNELTLTFNKEVCPTINPDGYNFNSSHYSLSNPDIQVTGYNQPADKTQVNLTLSKPVTYGEALSLTLTSDAFEDFEDLNHNTIKPLNTGLPVDTTVQNIQNLTLNTSTYVIPINGVFNIQAIGRYKDGQTKDVTQLATYSPSDSTVIAFTSKNKVIGTNIGETDINVSYGGKTATVHVKVLSLADYKAFVRKQIDPTNKRISLGDIIKFIKSGDDTNRDGVVDQNDAQYVLEFIDPKSPKQ